MKKTISRIVITGLILFGSLSYADECTLPDNVKTGVVYESFVVGSNKYSNAEIVEINTASCWMKIVRVSINKELWLNLKLLSAIVP